MDALIMYGLGVVSVWGLIGAVAKPKSWSGHAMCALMAFIWPGLIPPMLVVAAIAEIFGRNFPLAQSPDKL